MPWNFACSRNNVNLCFNSGVCLEQNSTCECLPGTTSDVDWFHFPNCAKYVNSTKDFLIFYSVFTCFIFGLYFWKPFWHLKKKTRQIGILCMLQVFSSFLCVLLIYLQIGCYEGCAATITVLFVLSGIIVEKIILLILTPVFLSQKKSIAKFRRFLRYWTFFSCVSLICSGLAMLLLSRAETQAGLLSYNIAAFLHTLFFWIAACVDMLAFFITANQLQGEIHESFVNTKAATNPYSDLERRLKLLRLGSFILFVMFLVIMFLITIVLSIFGSFPYFYVVFYLELVIGECFVAAILPFVMLPTTEVISKKSGSIILVESKQTVSNDTGVQLAPSVPLVN